jgi:NAD(P)-dependent dehydrogenase (short-subunit alcohol dehydrogenase family)
MLKRILLRGIYVSRTNEQTLSCFPFRVNVFAGCLTEKGEDELRKACSPRLKPVSLNVANHDSVLQAYEAVSGMLPEGTGLWGVFNNAGIAGKVGPAEWLRLDDYRQVFDINLLGLVDVTVTFLPLIKRARGRVINTASVFGRHTISGSTPYCCSKYAVESFSDSLRRMMRPFGVTVHIIEPGFHKTNITSKQGLESALRASWEQAPPELKEEYGEEYLSGSIDEMLKTFISGVISERISDVVDAYEHAVLGRFPRARYVVGRDAKLLWLPLQWLPEWLGDFVIDRMTKDKPTPRACRHGQ